MERPIDSHYKLLIDGKWVDAKDGATLETYCPADGTLLATCAQASQEDVDMAVQLRGRRSRLGKMSAPRKDPLSF